MLVWLVLAGLVLGGLATMVVAFSAERVLSSLSAANAPSHGAGEAAGHDEDGVTHDEDDSMGHDDDSGSHDTAMPMHLSTTATSPTMDHGGTRPVATATSAGHDESAGHGAAPAP